MSALVVAARKYLGVPFRHRGRTPRGLDCAGLVWLAYADCGVTLPDVRVYGREPHRDGLRDAVRRALGDPLPEGADLHPGDVLLMRFEVEPHHIALVGDYAHGGESLIHSFGDVGRVVEHRLDAFWRGRILEVYRREP